MIPQDHRLEPWEAGCRESFEPKQYASDLYQSLLAERGIVCSMSRRKDCWDNAVVESFFGTLKTELLHRQPWPTRQAAATAVAEYLEIFHNRYRRHSFVSYMSPADYEAQLCIEDEEAA